MTISELRAKVVACAREFYDLGCRDSEGTHRQIVDIYNSQRPLPVGYKVTYTDAWCAAFVSAVGVKLGLTDIILPECGCGRMITLYKRAGRWTENDAYVPNPGDIIMYDWSDTGAGDNVGEADHVGIVCAADSSTITVIEGNKNNAVGYRYVPINGRYIRGFCLPNYAGRADESAPATDWSGDARQWAVANGLVLGTGIGADGKTEYSWNSSVTRAQLVTVLYRFAKMIGKA